MVTLDAAATKVRSALDESHIVTAAAEHRYWALFPNMENNKSMKKGKKKKEKRTTAKKDDHLTFPEALLAYQIQAKESMIQILQAEFTQLEEKHSRFNERNERLRAEQKAHIKVLLDEAKAEEEELSKKEVVNREQVEMEIKQKWDYIREKRRLFEELRSEIKRLAEQNVEKQRERDYWFQYKNVGSGEHARQIRLLEEEIKSLTQSFSEVDGHLKKQLETSKGEVNRQMEELKKKKLGIAAKEALEHLSAANQKPIDENAWLKSQITYYRKEVQELEEKVHKLEQENLEMQMAQYKTKAIKDSELRGPALEKWLPIEGRAIQIHPPDPRTDDPENPRHSRPHSRQKWTITPSMRRMAMS
ncbi:coiled-coil domain-containing protein 83 [Spea bombifrons]|uniref:coiled-coil domain-containing protein 83 n=1 Tax=Spea bombifrons TaxID=233779 RepID=UPI002349DC2A|nr:coiled-coil domain-containing protein 83 [Spea bombifrons]